jgi:signal transduction histidine kinase
MNINYPDMDYENKSKEDLEAELRELQQKYDALLNSYETDIPENKQTNDMQFKTALLEAQMNASLDGILLIDENKKRLLVNERYIDMFDVPRYALETDDDTYLLQYIRSLTKNPSEFLEKVIYLYNHVKETSSDEIEFLNGMIIERYSAPVLGKDGKYYGRIWTFHDITEKKQSEILLYEKNDELIKSNIELIKAKEHAEESDHLKTAFLQNMSHEIRTPMNAIMGFATLLTKQYNNKPKLEKFAGIINQRCNDLLCIINDILDIAKIESGQLPVNINECNLEVLFCELTSFFSENQNRMGKLQIEFNLLSDCTECVILTDEVKLKQIFINLISNAFKFTEKGTITGGCKYDENGNIIFYVSDTGFGIPPEKHALVFERFTQINQGYNRSFGGTGLGLSIVKGLLNLLGGKIWVESELNKGSNFFFTFPVKIVQQKKDISLARKA